ncbi:hypothetical protein MVEN_00860500 [Mycena venus]|uniref:Uncharacterized protein n=1 Tax=Mycena venus TaxID=2733690 RepID=A0A8H6YFN6_9AGAR|nr:hypothetical protein MVEN_00860500 [Mycena venus]
MSILVGAVHTSSVALSQSSAETVLSRRFVSSHFPSHPSSLYAFTINGGPHGSFTTVLDCTVSSSLTTDVSLGLDWKASLREWYIGLDLRITSGFELENLHAILPAASLAAAPEDFVADRHTEPPQYSGFLPALSGAPSATAPRCGMPFSSLHAAAAAIGSTLPLTQSVAYAPAFALSSVRAHHTSAAYVPASATYASASASATYASASSSATYASAPSVPEL